MGAKIIFLCSLFFVFSITNIVAALPLTQQQDLDRITSLPGQPPVSFSQFSGYVTVNEVSGRALFYWLTEATTEPEKKPLVLWLNGGPGCSSLAFGASEEIGPFRINKTGSTLFLNKHSWNKDANLLFLESPAGVGFSYTNTSSDLNYSGDERTAQDSLVFLLNWLKRFPQYEHRDFYITGESYAGHYVPQLAKKIYEYNKGCPNPIINLRGFMVGNAIIDDYYDSIGTVTYWWSHALISDKTYHSILKNCDFTQKETSPACDDIASYAVVHEIGAIDRYSIYTPLCKGSSNGTGTVRSVRLKNTLIRRRVSGYDPCSEKYAEKYWNRRDVQIAFHANTTGIPYKWTACSGVIKNWTDMADSMFPIYKELMAAGLRIWVFSGDTDSVVPVTATRFSLSHLNLTTKIPWYPWYAGHQVGGWTEVYDGLTFATVRGAGHEVPLFQPLRASVLFKSFLSGRELPKM